MMCNLIGLCLSLKGETDRLPYGEVKGLEVSF